MAKSRMSARAGTLSGVVTAYPPSVLIGTPLAPRLMEAAVEAAARAAAAASGSADELDGCMVTILCAHAAVEARMNEAGEGLGEWWDDREALRIEAKWADLVERKSGSRPARGTPQRQALQRLVADRNILAHFKGVPVPGMGKVVSAPPVSARGGISAVRAYFDKARAGARLADAKAAIDAIGP